jgi:RNA polymerase sigma-70 factor, ECF subfamily
MMNSSQTTCFSDPPPDCIEQAEILAEIARGDMYRFDVLVNQYKERLMRYVSHRVADRHHAEDLVQETFLRMFRAVQKGNYTGQATVPAWLFTIAGNCVTDYLRGLGRRRLTLESDAAVRDSDDSAGMLERCHSTDLGPLEAASRHESQGRADALLDCLPEEQRRVVALKVLGGLTLQEVAEVVGCPLGTVKSRLLYGLRKIEAMLAHLASCKHER